MMATWWKDCLLNHLTQVWYITLSFYSRGLNWIQLIALINYVVHPFQFQILDGSLSVYFINVQSIHLKTPNRRRTCRVTVNLWRTQFYHILRNGTRMPPIHFTQLLRDFHLQLNHACNPENMTRFLYMRPFTSLPWRDWTWTFASLVGMRRAKRRWPCLEAWLSPRPLSRLTAAPSVA